MATKFKLAGPYVPGAEVEEAVQPFYIKVEKEGSSVLIVAVKPNGDKIESGNLVRIGPGGMVRFRSVNRGLGLPLDDVGRLNLEVC